MADGHPVYNYPNGEKRDGAQINRFLAEYLSA
jgi:hypothetical protein